MSIRMSLVVLAVVGGLLLSGCGASTPASSSTPTVPSTPTNDMTNPSLAGTSWLLETLNGQPLVPDTQITLNFDAAAASGTDGCNRYSGSYTVDGEQITITNIASTMMACAEPVMQQATAYAAVLQEAATYSIAGQQLTLSEASGSPLAIFTQQSRDLSGTSWTVTGYNNGKQAVVSVLSGSTLTADFAADGTLSGSAGCNTYTTTYEASGESLTIGPAASTRKACAEPAGVMEQEAQFLQALETVATYRIDGDKLELRTAAGALAVTALRTAP